MSRLWALWEETVGARGHTIVSYQVGDLSYFRRSLGVFSMPASAVA